MNLVKLAHTLWKDHLRKGMRVIDATMGNGYDTLFLTQHVIDESQGSVHAFDIQIDALDATRQRLNSVFCPQICDRVHLYHRSHETFPEGLKSIDLIVYNLGYRPLGDKQITTLADSTIKSCQNGLEILSQQGLMSILIYPAHSQGLDEKNALFEWFLTLDSNSYYISIHSPFNRPNAPILALIGKIKF